jgi:hypothetical protein
MSECRQVWSPLEIEVFLHHRCCVDPFGRGGRLYVEILDKLTKLGLIDPTIEGRPIVTPKGEAFCSMLLSTPVPIEGYIDPRTGLVIGRR